MPTFNTIATFQYTSEAQIIKGRLEAEGINVYLQDNLTIDTDPLVSNAIGGVKLRVLEKDTLKANHILNSMHQYALDNDGNAVVCPKCNSNEVQLFSTINSLKSLFAFTVGLISGTLPMHTQYKYQCNNCKHEFGLENQNKVK